MDSEVLVSVVVWVPARPQKLFSSLAEVVLPELARPGSSGVPRSTFPDVRT